MSLHRPLLITTGLIFLSIVIAIAVFVYTFDLNRYRQEIAGRLSTAIDRPVRLGEAHLSLRPELALSFADLRIGPAETGENELSAARLDLLVEPWSLFKGELALRKVVLEAPRLTLTLGPAAHKSPARSTAPREILKTVLIRTLRIEEGEVVIRDRRDPRLPSDYKVRNIRGEIADLSLDSPWRFDLIAGLVQGEKTAPLSLAGKIVPPAEPARWRDTRLDLHMTAQRMDPSFLFRSDSVETEGRLALKLDLTGAPASGLQIEGSLSGNDFFLLLPHLYRSPLPLRQAMIKTAWTSGAKTDKFTDLALRVDEIAMNGNLALSRRGGKLWAEGELSAPDLPLDETRRFLPDHGSPLAARLKEDLTAGTLRLGALRFAGYPDRFRHFDEEFPLREGSLSVSGAAFRLNPTQSVSGISFAAYWGDRRLILKEGRGVVLGSPFEFSGSLNLAAKGDPEVSLSARGSASTRDLFSLLPEEKRAGFTVEGPLPFDVEIDGSLDRLMVDLKADLNELGLRLPGKFEKPPGLPGNLFLTGEITPGRLDLGHGLLSIPPLELRVRGGLEREGEKGYSLVLDSAPVDLQKTGALFHIPLPAKFGPAGKIGIHYEVEGKTGKIDRRGGTVSLRNFGIHLPGPVGDISDANGEILISENRAEFSRLTARIGSSLLNVDGALEDFSDPRLDLRVKAKAIRANDLIFSSDRAVLRDVDGHLRISRKGIDFAPVKVRLDGGTRATVEGTLRNFKAPVTSLKISAEYGDIDEVIALWHRSPEASHEEGEKHRSSRLHIDAKVREGKLGPLHFQNALGEITFRDGVLNIYPLRFSAGSGSCVGQVAVDMRGGPPPLLKISGHLEDIDAEALHHELLKKRGLITGTLSGDFYLEGRAGSEFLPTSLGGFDLKVKDGVLLKFKFLSKVFSLLNVSQILSLKLPDMDDKGMPFERLKGTFGLRSGVLSTEDLFVKSNAMNLSLVGDADLVKGKIDMLLGVKPLRTVDKIITQIPIAGWLLTGDEKALITAHFHIKGKSVDPEVIPVPITSVSEKVQGIFKRILELPGKIVTDVGSVLEGEKKK